MKTHKVVVFGNVPIGTKLFLTKAQAAARSHALTKVKAATEATRGVYVANQQLGFKAGEEIGVDGKLDRGLEQMFGIAEPATPTKRPTAAQKQLAAAKDEFLAAKLAAGQAASAAKAAPDDTKLAAATKRTAAAVERAEKAFVKAGGKLEEIG